MRRGYGLFLFLALVLAGAGLNGCKGPEIVSATSTVMVSEQIAASPERVFSYVNDVNNLQAWTWAKASNLKGEGIGRTLDWEVEAGGLTFKGQTVVVDVFPNEKIVENFMGDASGANTYLFVPEGGGTRLVLVQEATAQAPRTLKDLVIQKNKEKLQQALAKVKAAVEQLPPEAPKVEPPAAIPTAILVSTETYNIEIKAPVEKVFAFVANPMNTPQYYPEVKSVSNVVGEGPGMSWDTVAEFTQEPWKGRYEVHDVVVDFVPNQKIVDMVAGPFIDNWTWLFQPTADGGTRIVLVLQGSYELPAPSGREAAAQALAREDRRIADTILNNIKTALEQQNAPQPPPVPH